jgi:NAD(P) transhydrogenase subunit beta
MSKGSVTAAYIMAAILFILSLAGLSKQETARKGNKFGIIGMAVALIVTILSVNVQSIIFILAAMIIVGLIGVRLALKVEMSLFGWHLVASIGGADMPVVISMLNSYSGWAAAAAGFMLSKDLLIVTGALVGSSGAILSYIMCKAMNRSFISVIAGGFGNEGATADDAEEMGEYREFSSEDVAQVLKQSISVIITPGYGSGSGSISRC